MRRVLPRAGYRSTVMNSNLASRTLPRESIITRDDCRAVVSVCRRLGLRTASGSPVAS
jgi:hypothetical protein